MISIPPNSESSQLPWADDIVAGSIRIALGRGDRVAAVGHYGDYARACARENRAPRPELTALFRQALRAPEAARDPSPPAPFFGRETELADVLSALDDGVAAVVLHGPGGVGKTRLAVAVADAARTRFDDVRWSSLGDVEGDPLATIEAACDGASLGARVLIVIDEAERHAVRVESTRRLLRLAAPGWTFLVTTRFAQPVDDATLVRVAPFACDASRAQAMPAAVAFLVDRALAAGVRLPADRATTDTLHALAARVDGLALALELVAAQLRTFSPSESLARMDAAGLTNRFAERAVAASVAALGAIERASFVRFGAFPGRWTFADAAAALADDEPLARALPATLERLVAWSLISTELVGRTMTYRYLTTTQDVARAALAADGALDATFARVAGAVLQRAVDLGPRATAADPAAVEELEASFSTLCAAIVRTGGELPARALATTARFWAHAGHARAGLDLIDRVASPSDPELAVRLALTECACAREISQWKRASAALDRALPIAEALGDDGLLGQVLRSLGAVAFGRGDTVASRTAIERAVALEAPGSLQWARTLANLSVLLTASGLHDEALIVYDRIEAACDDTHLALASAVGRATCFGVKGDAAGTRAWIDRAHALLGPAPSPGDAALVGHGETLAFTLLGDGPAALAAARAALAIARVHDLTLFTTLVTGLVPIVAAAVCEPGAVARIYGYAEAIARRDNVTGEPALQLAHARATATLRARLGDAEFDSARRVGAAMATADIVDSVFALADVAESEPERRARDRTVVRLALGSVERDGTSIALAPRERDLVNALVAAERAVSRERLVDALWPDGRAADGANALRVTLHRLRAKLGAAATIERIGDAFRLDPRIDVDLTEVERILRRRDRLQLEILARFVDDVRRSSDLPSSERPWTSAIDRRVERAAQSSALRLAESLLIAGDHARALDYATWCCDVDLFDEEAVVLAVRAWTALGDAGAARRLHDDYATRLRAELDVEPGDALRTLFR